MSRDLSLFHSGQLHDALTADPGENAERGGRSAQRTVLPPKQIPRSTFGGHSFFCKEQRVLGANSTRRRKRASKELAPRTRCSLQKKEWPPKVLRGICKEQ